MVASTLRSRIESLESSSNSLEAWLHFWTALVAVGLVVEFFFIFVDDKGSIKRRGKLIFEVFGTGLITLGVAGEFFVGIMSAKVNDDLRTANLQLSDSFNVEAATARKEAELARSQSAGAISLIEASKRENLALGLRLAEQQERAANAEKAFLEFRQRFAPRTIEPMALSRFRDALRASRYKGHVAIGANALDPEANALASQIASVLNTTGWPAVVNTIMETGQPFVGLGLFIHTSLASDTRYGYELERALKLTGLDVVARNVPGEGEGSVELRVGSKPLPAIAPTAR